jgi:hypothetical protein
MEDRGLGLKGSVGNSKRNRNSSKSPFSLQVLFQSTDPNTPLIILLMQDPVVKTKKNWTAV